MLDDQLVAVPLFVFMGIMMEKAGLMERLFSAIQLMMSGTRGALFIAVLFVSTIFAAATGIVGASVTILGIMAARTMNRSNYNVKMAAGTITAGGTLGILIPPSIMLVVMGPVLEVPVTDLFAAAIIPGALLAGLYIVYSVGRCWINPSLGPVLPEDRLGRLPPESAHGTAQHRGHGSSPSRRFDSTRRPMLAMMIDAITTMIEYEDARPNRLPPPIERCAMPAPGGHQVVNHAQQPGAE